jgi:hypothetical protein
MALSSLSVVVATTTMTTTVAYAQEAGAGGRPDEAASMDPSPEAIQLAVSVITSQLRNMTSANSNSDPLITFTEDGRLTIVNSVYVDGELEVLITNALHPYTTENGYKIDNGVLIAPNGTQVFP